MAFDVVDRTAWDESTLVLALRRGDGDAFEELVRTYGPRLLAVARRTLGNEEDARDALQTAFLSAFQALPTFRGGAQLSTWLHRIVVNAALMKVRSRRRKPEASIDDLLPRFVADGHHAAEVVDWSMSPERQIEQNETRAFVRACIDRLPETYRTVLILRDIEELSTEEAASALEISPNAVKIRLHRARQALMTLAARRNVETVKRQAP